MHHVEAHIAGAGDAHDRVQVGAVVIAEAPRRVHDLGDGEDVFVEQAHRVGVGEHEAGGVRPGGRAQGAEIHAAVRQGGDVHHLEACHGRAGGVCAVGGIRHQHFCAGAVAPGGVVGFDKQKAGEFAVGACRRLKVHGVHAGDLAQIPLGLGQGFQAALHRVRGLQGMHAGETGQRRGRFARLGVVLHGAGAQGVEAAVHAAGAPGKRRVMAAELGLADLGQAGRGRAGKPAQVGQGQGAGGHKIAPAPGGAALKNQFHALPTSFKMAASVSISSGVFSSVAHQSSSFSPTGRPPRYPRASSARSACAAGTGQVVTNSWK